MKESEKQELRDKIVDVVNKINEEKFLESIYWFAKTILDKFSK